MNTKRKAGRPSIDGAKNCTARLNAAITPKHKRMLDELAKASGGISPWLRSAIEAAHTTLKARQ
jgi:uncharacterized protein (DUF1778 family)